MNHNCPFDINPYDKADQIKNPILSNVNYTNQSYWSLKTRLIDFIKERFEDDFNDFVESSIAIMLIENWAFIADTLHFKIDQIANEIFIDSVSEVDNAFRLALLVGYKPLPPIASRSMWSVSLNNVLNTNVVIPTPVIINITTEVGPRTIELFPADVNKEPIYEDPIVITAGAFINTNVIGLEGSTKVASSSGTGESNQSIALSFGPVIWGSVRVKVDGVSWEQVDYFTDSQPRLEYRVEYDPNYYAFVIFGNNSAGQIPSKGSVIEITYRTGGGVAGNIVTGVVNHQQNALVPGFDFRVPVSFRNYTKGDYGYDGDSIEDIKRKIPKYLRSQNRLVSSDDFDSFINSFSTQYHGSIGKSTSVLRQHGCAANAIDVYVLARSNANDLSIATDELKAALRTEINEKKMINNTVCIKDGEVVEVDVVIDVVMSKFYKKFQDEFEVKITRRLDSFFSLNNWYYGRSLKSNDLNKSVSDIAEIKNVEVSLITNDETNSGDMVTTKYYQIIRPSTVEVNFMYE